MSSPAMETHIQEEKVTDKPSLVLHRAHRYVLIVKTDILPKLMQLILI